ncbi:MAG: serine protease [Aphanothece sp. CMT-3BRIN-NPC111]|jgi:tetratricopeptide (TPR) repeat protein|nr:serine protease [Aphanothece sp. CMT-3BRIN-NPC111]
MSIDFYRYNILPSLLVGTTTIAAIVSFYPAAMAAKSPQEIAQIANLITVQVNTSIPGKGSGSGVIIAKNGNNYTVLTANHVQRDVGENPTIRTYDGNSYPVTNMQSLGSLENEKDPDLAVLTFTAASNYQPATVGNSDQAVLGSQIFVFGYPVQGVGEDRKIGADRDSEFSPGYITSRRSGAKYGYAIRYNAVTLGGMSGGSVLDVDGRVIGIHGLGDQDLGKGVTESGQDVSVKIKTGFNSAIPINAFVAMRSKIGKNAENIAINNTASTDNAAARITNPQSTTDFVVAGLVQTEKGNNSAAVKHYTEAISRDANNAEAYYQRANTRYSQGDDTGAVEDYTEAINRNPNYVTAYFNRGFIRLNQKDSKGAIEDFSSVIRLDPNDVLAYYNRAAARSQQQDKEGTIADYSQVISIDSNYVPAYMERARFRNSLGDRKGAIEDYTVAIGIVGNDPSSSNHAIAKYNRGILRRNLGDRQGALEDLQSAATLFEQQKETAYYQKAMDEIKWLSREIGVPSNPSPVNNSNQGGTEGGI